MRAMVNFSLFNTNEVSNSAQHGVKSLRFAPAGDSGAILVLSAHW